MDHTGNNGTNERLDKIEKTLEKLVTALLGDEYTNGVGYFKRIDHLDDRVKSLEKNQNSLKWFIFGSGLTGGAGLVKVLESFLN